MPPSPRGAPSCAPSPQEKLRKRAQRLSNLAMKTLAEIMKGDGQDAVRLAAAREVLDRGHGRAKVGETAGGEGDRLTVVVKRFTDAPDPYEAANAPEVT